VLNQGGRNAPVFKRSDMEILTTIINVIVAIATVGTLIYAIKVFAKSQMKDTVKDRNLCVEHSKTIENIKEDIDVLFNKMEVVAKNTTDIEVIKIILERIEKKTNETHQLLIEQIKGEKR
jgi:hypothetical protein